MKYLFMAVTADEYELPVIVEPGLRAIANKLGVKYSTVRRALFRGSRMIKNPVKIVRVNFDEDN